MNRFFDYNNPTVHFMSKQIAIVHRSEDQAITRVTSIEVSLLLLCSILYLIINQKKGTKRLIKQIPTGLYVFYTNGNLSV